MLLMHYVMILEKHTFSTRLTTFIFLSGIVLFYYNYACTLYRVLKAVCLWHVKSDVLIIMLVIIIIIAAI